MLHIENLHAFYGKSHVLHGVNFQVGEGEIVGLLGRNGSGRSTTAKAVMGLIDAQGTVNWRGRNLVGLKAYQVAHLGIGYVPAFLVREDVEAGRLVTKKVMNAPTLRLTVAWRTEHQKILAHGRTASAKLSLHPGP